MLTYIILVLSLNSVFCQSCYFNDGCAYQLFSSKTPYDSVRGDIRDYAIPQNCRAVSVWSLNRHGNRNPGGSVTDSIRVIAGLRDQIVNSYDSGTSELCAQDIDTFRRWTWNETLEISQSFLTGTGYEEIYDIASRLRQKYPHLLEGSEEDYYFRTTNEQRTITSSIAFVHGLTEGTNLSLPVDGPWERDDIIRSYQNCDRYQQEVRGGQPLADQMNAYFLSHEFVTVQNNVQRRLGIATQLSTDDIYSFYEICRFYRSWEPNLKSPWCSVFSNEDLVVLEYRDDVRHYHRNGYGSWINVNLGGPVVKDLYETFAAAVAGDGKKVTAYFTHDTMIEMAVCAMGLFRDNYILQGGTRNPSRLWRSSYIGSFSANIVAVLNTCEASNGQEYRVQLFANERPTELCPLEGCSWSQFRDLFQRFVTADLEFCSLTTRQPGNGAAISKSSLISILSIVTYFSILQ